MANLAFEGPKLSDMNAFREAMHKATVNPPWLNKNQQHAQRWNPYSFEGGTVVSIADKDFAVIGCDTRMSFMEFVVINREAEKLHVLNDNIIIATGGFYGDAIQLKRVLDSRLHKYRFDYRCDMTVDLCSELLARNLYYKRFFPYLTHVVVCGVDEHGKGALFRYDPVGCIERVKSTCSGAGEAIIQPFLDNQIDQDHINKESDKQELTLERAIGLLKDSFRFAADRETSVADKIDIAVAEHGKPIKRFTVPLRED